MVFHSPDSPGAMDRAIRSLVPQKVNGRRIVAVVTFAESWFNQDEDVVTAGIHRGENFNLEGLPGTFDVITLILDSPNVQGMWTNKLVGTIPNRSPGTWERMKVMRFKRFANYYSQSRN